jgi:hypothetical protein
VWSCSSIGGHFNLLVPALATFLTSAAEVPVKDGLLLQLDAASQFALRNAADLPPMANGRPLDRWLDSSGGSFFAAQPSAAGRPVFRADDSEAFVRFDGKDDFLSISGPRRRANEVTVVVLAVGSASFVTAVVNRRASSRNGAYGAVSCSAPQLPGETVNVTLAACESA